MKKIIVTLGFVIFASHVSAQSVGGYLTTAVGIDNRQTKGDTTTARYGYGGALQAQIGKRWHSFDLSIAGDFNAGKVDQLSQTLNGTKVSGNYTYNAFSIGPQFRLFFGESSGKYEWSIFTGPVYAFIDYDGRSFVDTVNIREEDVEISRRGFGGLIGLGLSQKLENKYIDRVQYQLTYKQLHYDRIDATYESGSSTASLKGKFDDKFVDRSILLTVGLTFGAENFANAWSKAKSVASAF